MRSTSTSPQPPLTSWWHRLSLRRVAIMRKGGVIRLRDYCPSGLPQTLCLGLAWDVTNGVNIDLDASAIMLDAKVRPCNLP